MEEYLDRMMVSGLISQDVKQKSYDLWMSIKELCHEMPVPSATTGPDGLMAYCWDKDEHHLELEIYSNCDVEFFYRNRRTNELLVENCLSVIEIMDKLKLFV